MEQAAARGAHPHFLQQRGPEELLPSLPPMAQRAWPDPSLPQLPAPSQGDFFSLSSEHWTRIDGSLPNATRARWARSSVRVSMTRGHVTRRHRRCHPATACTESSFTTAKPPGSFPFPLLAPALAESHLVQSSFPGRECRGHSWHSRAPGNEVCCRSQMESGAIL